MIKKYILILTIALSSALNVFSQGSSCAGMGPICTSNGLTFTAQTGLPDADVTDPGNNYGCLAATPNPSWYYLEISSNGDVEMELSAPSDVDFALWGPFPDLATAQSGCGSYGAPLGDFGGFLCPLICDFQGCSFSTSAVETPGIENAVAGEVYVMLVTNYSSTVQNISLTQTGGTGATDCSIVTAPCIMNTLTADVVSCASTPFLEFEVGGTVTYTNPPTTGQLIVEDCYGQQQVFNAPFGTSMNYSITGLPQDGLDCNITAYFTAEPTCTITDPVTSPSPITSFSSNCVLGAGQVTGTIGFSNPAAGANLIVEITDGVTTVQDVITMPAASPANWSVTGLDPAINPYTITYYFDNNPTCSQSQVINCGCSADGGTTTPSMTGNGTNNFVLCENDQLNITNNNDFAFPDDEGPIGGFAYIPAMVYLVYTCPPTPGVFPGSDPCFFTIIDQVTNLTDINDPASIFALYGGSGTFPNNTLYYAPVTLYHYDPLAGNYILNSNCWDIGTVTSVTYLDPITEVATPDCQTASVAVTLTGGDPALNASDFTASNLLPTSASFANTTCANNGDIVINGLANGDMWSFDVFDVNGCPHTVSGGPFVGVPFADAGLDDAECSLTYTMAANASFGTGAWIGTGGAVFATPTSPTSSVTVPAAGSYTLTWTEDNGSGCVDSDDVIVQFSDVQYTEVTLDPTCGNADGGITLNGNSGMPVYSYSIDGGLTTQAGGTFALLSAGVFPIAVEDNIGCIATGSITLSNAGGPVINSVNSNDISCSAACDGDISINATGATMFSVDNGVNFQALNNFTALCAGTYDIVVEDAIGCAATSSVIITEPAALAHTTIQVDLVCAGQCIGEIDITEAGGTAPYQYSIDNGVNNSPVGLFQNLCAGNYTVLVTDANLCATTSSVVITEPNPMTITIGITDATCFGVCDGVMNSIPAGGTGAGTYTYAWTPAATGGNVPLVTNLCAGSYNLSVTDGNGCILDTTGIVVGAPIAVSIDNVVEVDELCGGDCTGQITVTSASATSYSIDGLNFSPSNTFSNLCAGNYTVEVQDGDGCSAQSPAVIAGPVPVTLVTSADTTICIGGAATLNAVALGGVGGFTYNWDNGAGATQNPNVSPVASTIYCATATDANGCSSPLLCVAVNLNPALNVVALSDQAICEGLSADINALASGGDGGPYTYTWDQGVGQGQFQSVTPAFTTSYTVTASDGCETPDVSATITITVNTVPNISFIADNLSGCYPVSVNFTEQNVPAGASCLWTFGDGGADANCSNVSYDFNTPGCWDITLDITTIEGCQASATIPNYICAYDYPNPEFSFEPQPTTVLDPTINFINETPDASTYNWIFDVEGEEGTSTLENPSYSFLPNAQTYEVCLEAITVNGCPDTICHDVVILEEFLVYVPNAFTPNGDLKNNYFKPIISGVKPLTYEFLIFNRWGELIYQDNYLESDGWDGIYNNVMSQQDVYVWKLRVQDQTGKKHDFVGHVTLIK
jgi:gliding motility-associated-like protein